MLLRASERNEYAPTWIAATSLDEAHLVPAEAVQAVRLVLRATSPSSEPLR